MLVKNCKEKMDNYGKSGGLMVSALDSGLSSLGFEPLLLQCPSPYWCINGYG